MKTPLRHVPVILMLLIYLPGALFGMYIFHDEYAASFFTLLCMFVVSYYFLYFRIVNARRLNGIKPLLLHLGDGINWRVLAWCAVLTYLITIIVASVTTQYTPLGAAVRGGSLMDIAKARADLFATRDGPWGILRYLATILGRSVMPFLVVLAFHSQYKFRYLALALLLFCYMLSLEKASAVFAFLPLILLCSMESKWKAASLHFAALLLCLGLWTSLAVGPFEKQNLSLYSAVPTKSYEATPASKPTESMEGPHGDPKRFYVFRYLNEMGLPPIFLGKDFTDNDYSFDPRTQILAIINRCIWIPYITAYDWLKFQDEILHGQLTYGQQIGAVSWLLGKRKLPLERMVYVYQFGEPPGGAGGSNTVFFVDAKLAFGWLGALLYCMLVPVFAAAIFSSGNRAAQVASITSFFTLALSPLTATLLSGGLFFYVLVCVFVRPFAQLPQGAAMEVRLKVAI